MRSKMTRREALETIYIIYIIAIRKTSIRCTITPSIPSKNTTLANNCRVHRVWIKDGRGPDADWRTRIGGRGLADADWRTRTGGRGLADADWRTRTGGRGLADADWRTRTGGRGLRAFQPRILTRNVRIFKLKHI